MLQIWKVILKNFLFIISLFLNEHTDNDRIWIKCQLNIWPWKCYRSNAVNVLSIFYSSQQARYYELCKNEHQFFKAIDVTPLYGENKVLALNETCSWSKLMWSKQSSLKIFIRQKRFHSCTLQYTFCKQSFPVVFNAVILMLMF